MTYDMMKLARRAVACDGWRWMPAMLICPRAGDPAYRIVGVWLVEETRACTHWKDPAVIPMRRDPVGLPDLTDPATLGCVLALVAERHGVTLDDVHVVRTGRVWSVWVFYSDDASRRVATHLPSRAAALVAALEAAPVGGAS